jgi:hypothetical protein
MEGAKGGTMSLGFKTLPMVFAQMPAGNLFGAAFFLILFLAAITSSLSMLQPTKAFLEESLGVNRQVSTTIVTMWGLAGNIFVLWFTHDLVALDTIDFWVGTFFIWSSPACRSSLRLDLRRRQGTRRSASRRAHAHPARLQVHHQVRVARVPAVVIVGFCIMFNVVDRTGDDGQVIEGYWTKIWAADNKVERLALGLIGLVALCLIIATAIGEKRWRAQGLDVDGVKPLDANVK